MPYINGTHQQPGDPMRAHALKTLFLVSMLHGCAGAPGLEAKIRDFATRYTAAWCSQDPGRVAAFFAPTGSLTINGGTPAVGRDEITAAAQGFMTAFPDLKVLMDSVIVQGRDRAVYHWTLVGTNTGPGGAGRAVRISGFEEWRFGADGLIAESQGHYDAGEYQRQVSPLP